MKFQIDSPIPLKSSKSFVLEEFICLLAMYLAIKFKESLIFLVSKAMYSIKLCKEMG